MKLNPSFGAFYDIQPGNGLGLLYSLAPGAHTWQTMNHVH